MGTADAVYKTRTHLPDAKRGLEGKWYYKKCMESKNSNSWRGRPDTSLPMTTECFYTAYDATVARDYFWDIKFSGMVPRLMKMGVIKPCVATIDYVRTMDNVT